MVLNLKDINRSKFQHFPFHLVDQSPWPILVSFALLSLTTGAVMHFHGIIDSNFVFNLGFILTGFGMILWFRDIVIEGALLGNHTKEVQKGLEIGVLLFIVSEVFAFLSVFWAFLHASLAPAIEIGAQWPPRGITPLDPFAVPLLNTVYRDISLFLENAAVLVKYQLYKYFFTSYLVENQNLFSLIPILKASFLMTMSVCAKPKIGLGFAGRKNKFPLPRVLESKTIQKNPIA